MRRKGSSFTGTSAPAEWHVTEAALFHRVYSHSIFYRSPNVQPTYTKNVRDKHVVITESIQLEHFVLFSFSFQGILEKASSIKLCSRAGSTSPPELFPPHLCRGGTRLREEMRVQEMRQEAERKGGHRTLQGFLTRMNGV